MLPLAAAIHAGGTMLVIILAVRLTRSIEHPSPALAAAMNEEGVVSADHRCSEMVEEFKSPEADELGQWANVRSVRPQEDPAAASVAWLTPAIVVPLCVGLVAINVLSTARAGGQLVDIPCRDRDGGDRDDRRRGGLLRAGGGIRRQPQRRS